MTVQAALKETTQTPGPFDALMEITNRPNITFTQGRGGWLWDSTGKRYLDFVQGWAVNCLGHCPPTVASVLVEQSTKLLNCSPAFYNEPMVHFADELTEAAGADVCFDPVGGDLFDGALSALGWGGRYLHVGFVGGVPQVPANRLLVKHRSAMGSSLRYFRQRRPEQLRASVAELLAWWGDGLLRPEISAVYGLDAAAEAMTALAARKVAGKIVVRPGGNGAP